MSLDTLKKEIASAYKLKIQTLEQEEASATNISKRKAWIVLVFILAEIATIVVAARGGHKELMPWLAGLIGFTLIGGLVYIFYSSGDAKRSKDYNEIVSGIIKNTCEKLAPGFQFNEQGLDQEVLMNSGLIEKRSGTYKAHSTFYGQLQNQEIKVGYCELYYTSRSSKSDSSSSRVTLFEGTLMVLKSPTPRQGRTTLLTDISERLVGTLVGSFINTISSRLKYTTGNPVRFDENPEFEKYFKVQSDNEQEARQIVDQRMQTLILGLKNKIGSIQLSFIGDQIYIGIPNILPTYSSSSNLTNLTPAIVDYCALVFGIADTMLSLYTDEQTPASPILQSVFQEAIATTPDVKDTADAVIKSAGKGCKFIAAVSLFFFGGIMIVMSVVAVSLFGELGMIGGGVIGIVMCYIGYRLVRKKKPTSGVRL